MLYKLECACACVHMRVSTLAHDINSISSCVRKGKKSSESHALDKRIWKLLGIICQHNLRVQNARGSKGKKAKKKLQPFGNDTRLKLDLHLSASSRSSRCIISSETQFQASASFI